MFYVCLALCTPAYYTGGCVPMEGVCTYGRGAHLWKGCVPMEGVHTYGRGVYLGKVWKDIIN